MRAELYRIRGGVVTIGLLVIALSCKEPPPGPPPPNVYIPTIELAAVDTGVMDVWLKVRFGDSVQVRSFTLRRDGQVILTAAPSQADTLIGDTTASANRTYTYRAYRTLNGQVMDSSEVVQVTTMDSTNHLFSFIRIDTLGEGNSSALRDVAIISDNNVWAVGEMYLRDSTGGFDPNAYNVARWDGGRWNLMRVYFPICGTTDSASFPATSVFAFGTNDVWLTSAGTVAHWDGLAFTKMCLPAGSTQGSFNKMWRYGNDLYIVGTSGSITYHNVGAGTWARIESGTTVSINDIWGVVDPVSGKRTILCAATNTLQGGERKILSIRENNVVEMVAWPVQRELQSVWFQNTNRIFVCGDGVFVRLPNNAWVEQTGILQYTFRIRGTQQNDIIAVGGYGYVLHWNGVSFREYPEAAAALVYTSVAYDTDLMIAVGYTATRAVVVQMRR